jgi:hypothetical protein
MYVLPVPPRESIKPRPKKLIEDIQLFQEAQFEFFKKMEENLKSEETDSNSVVESLIEIEIESYNKMWDFINSI